MAWFWIVAALAAAWCERIWLKFPCRSAIWFSYCLRFQNVLVRGTKMTTKTVFSECLQVSKPSRIGHHLVDICFFEAMPMRLLRLLRNLPHSQRKAQLRNQKLLSWEVVISSKFQSILFFLHHPCRNFPTQAVALLFVAVFFTISCFEKFIPVYPYKPLNRWKDNSGADRPDSPPSP